MTRRVAEHRDQPSAGRAATVAGLLLGYATLGPGLGAGLLAPLVLANAEWLWQHSTAMLVPIAFGVVLLCGVALLPTFVATVLLCWLYGGVSGLLLTLLCTSLAALLGRLLAGVIGRRTVEPVLESHSRLRVVRDALLGSRSWSSGRTVALLRVSPVVPFAAVNVLAGLANVRLGAFFVGSVAGMLPRAAVVAFWTARLRSLSFDRPNDVGWLVAGIVVSLGALFLLGWWARRALRVGTEVNPPVPAGVAANAT